MNAATSARLQLEPRSRTVVPLPEPSPQASFLVFGICALLFFAVLSYGAVEEWSVSILEAGLAVLFLAWAARQVIAGELKIAASPLYAPAFLFGMVVAAQLAFGLSAYRYATLIASLEYLAYGMLLFLTVQSLTGERSAQAIIWALSLFGFALAVFAITQDLTSNGKIYWLRTLHNGGAPFGPYVNHDHYAGLMEMLAPIPMVLSLGSFFRGGKRALVAFAAVVMSGTIVLSQSRAGTASFLAEMALLLGIVMRAKKKGRAAAALGTVFVLVLAFVSWLATAALWHHFAELQDAMRVAMAKDGLRMFWHKPALGWGLGTFTTVYPRYRSFYTDLFVNAAHNDYVQALVETGAIGFAAVLWFLVEVFRANWHNTEAWTRDWSRALGLAALVGCTGLLVHGFFDFNLQIPANACMFYFLCAVATSTAMVPEGRNSLSTYAAFGNKRNDPSSE